MINRGLIAPPERHDEEVDQASFKASHVWKIMNTSSSIVNCRLFISIQIMNFVIILQFNEANKVKTGRIKRKYLLRGGSTSFQAKQTSGRVSSTDPKRLLFIKFIYSRLALLLLALQENAFDSDIRICSLHNTAVSDDKVSKVSFLPLMRNYLL